MLPPGVPGVTERIRVRSVVGRFLEHTRVLYFRWGEGDDDEALYLSSADWMSRNMFRRIEVAWPVRDARAAPACHRRMPGALPARPARCLAAGSRRPLPARGRRRRQRAAGADAALFGGRETDGPDPVAPRRGRSNARGAATTSSARSRPRASARPQRMADWLNQRLPQSHARARQPGAARAADRRGARPQLQDAWRRSRPTPTSRRC